MENVSLKEYINDKLDNLEKSIDVRFQSVSTTTDSALAAADKATLKAEIATEKRFESVNEFRSTLSDQAAKFIIRSEFELVVNRLEEDIKNLALAKAELVSIVTYDEAHKNLLKQVDELRLSRATLEGKASQESVSQVSTRAQLGILFGAIGTILAVAGFIINFI